MKIGSSSGCQATGSKKRGLDYHRRVYSRLRAFHTDSLATAGWTLLIEPWYKRLEPQPQRYRQPDAVLLHESSSTAIVVEVKLNWKDGRDRKLIDEYLGIVRSAEGLDLTSPLIITQCLRGWQGTPLKSLQDFRRCQAWQQGEITPLMLLL
jgi:hypothetical protein